MSSALVDIVDRDDRRRGFTASVNDAVKRGLWYRGINVVVYTPDGLILVERRSHTIRTYPDHLDISMGGIVNSGEDPLHTAVRELDEELGLKTTPGRLEHVSTTRYNHRLARPRRLPRTINYHYLLQIPEPHIVFHLQRSEVAEARFIPLSDARRLVHRHALPGFGHLIGRYAMYDALLDMVADRTRKNRP